MKKKKISVDSMTHEEIDALSAQVGGKIGKDIAKLTEKARKLLNPLGLDIKIMYITHEINTDPLKTLEEIQEAKAANNLL